MHPEMTLTAGVVDALLEAFNRQQIVYCHWKSNIDLAQATAGEIDLDLLVDRTALPRALTTLAGLGFKPAVARWGANPPSIRHFYGLDPTTQALIHVHLFTRVLTGESYVKSHLLPFETMLLETVYYVDQMPVTAKAAELVLFTVRMFIKYGSLLDLVTLARKTKSLQKEVRWLLDAGDPGDDPGDNLTDALTLLRKYCPVIDEQLFLTCVKTLDSNGPLLPRLVLAQQVRRRLAVYTKHTVFQRLLAYGGVLWAEVQRRLGGKQANKVLQAGGATVAFVGADATGKSTLVAETGRWLGDVFTVRVVHAGKPPSAWLTAPFNLLLPLVRGRTEKPALPLGDTENGGGPDPAAPKIKGVSSLILAVRAVVLAWDRRRLMVQVRRFVAQGEIVVCDRYPSRAVGAMDSPRLQANLRQTGLVARLYNRLARLEEDLYRQIPPPDIVLRLRVSLETARKRNNARSDQDGDAYLESRHRQSQEWQMPGTRYAYNIDTERSLEETICTVKQAVWQSL